MDINISDSKKVNLDMEAATTVYRHYKGNILPIAVIFACILILFFVIVPEFKQFLVLRETLKTETQKLDVLKNNYNFLSSLDETQTENDFKILSRALPPNKDFVGIMNGISVAAQKTNVSVGDFDFTLGDLDKISDESVFPTIKVDINLTGSVQSIAKFINELYKTVPVSEVTAIKAAGSAATLEIRFYYKPFPPQNISDETPVVPYSSKTTSLIKQISSWNNASEDLLFSFISTASGSPISSSPSADTNPSPF